MKCIAALSLAMAPLALAKAIHNVYPVEKRNGHSKSGAQLGGAQLGGGNVIAVGSTTQIIIIWVNPGNNAQTTTVNQAVTVTQTVTAGVADTTVGTATVPAGATGTVAAPGATHTVQVGGAAGLAYSPSELKAAVGDMVVFTFMSQNHTVTQSTFATPCDPMAGGMDSGFQANKDNAVVPAPQVAMQVMTSDPIWFYCAQTGHCVQGHPAEGPRCRQRHHRQCYIKRRRDEAATTSAAAGSATELPGTATEVAGGATETASAGGAIQTGTGQIVAGACVCAVTCGVGSFPAVNAQGIGNFGGIPGSIPASMAEVF
ncbi:hypothetical protein CIB48_g10550 [Xylaria polymorpha]|nr:hypothetical protein CIB48_g10550 [Xylaria polymorpha]